MVRNHGAGLLEDSPTRASAEPQVRPLAPCFTVRSQGRDMSPGIRPMCFGAPDFISCPLVNDALESRRAHPACLMGAAETHFPPNRPQITTLAPPDVRVLVFSAGLGGKDEPADRAESRPRSTMAPAKFPGYIESGDVQNTTTPMFFGGNMYENSCNVSTALLSPDPESFFGTSQAQERLRPRVRASSPLSNRTNHSSTLIAPLSAPPQQCL